MQVEATLKVAPNRGRPGVPCPQLRLSQDRMPIQQSWVREERLEQVAPDRSKLVKPCHQIRLSQDSLHREY
jgi:hypothetical protein